MKIKALNGRLLYTHNDNIGDEEEISGARISDRVKIAGSHIVVTGSQITGSGIGDSANLRLTKCEISAVDAANTQLEQSGWRDVLVTESRFTGALLNGAVLNNVVFKRSRLDMVRIQDAKLTQTRFEECDLRGAFFNGSNMTGSVFEGSNLTGADLTNARLEGCDLRRATIEDIRIAPDQLHQVIVTADQAIYLARLFGLVVDE